VIDAVVFAPQRLYHGRMSVKVPAVVALAVCLAVSACIEGKDRPADGGGGAGERLDLAGAPGQWITVEPGTFMMGPRQDLSCAVMNPKRKVTLTRGFEIAATEVTRAQFEEVVGSPSNPGSTCAACPATVQWYRAAAYCNGLSRLAGLPACYQCAGEGDAFTCTLDPKYDSPAQGTIHDCPGYRLPTEAEWEYAYRAGTQTDLYNGDLTRTSCTWPDPKLNVIAWYCDFDGEEVHPVGEKQPNPWGLHDMSGNAWEWCSDGFQNSLGSADAVDPWVPGPLKGYYMTRGGSHASTPCYAHAASRWERTPKESAGLRCVRSLAQP
jgi:formylglycine-generating enzyme required for sulfatase activity